MEEKYIPALNKMSIEEQAGVAESQKKLSERRFDRFKLGMEEVKERGFYDEADLQKIKDLRKDTEEITYRLEGIITYLQGVYMGRGKRSKELKEIEDYYIVITQTRAEVIKLSRNAVKDAKYRE